MRATGVRGLLALAACWVCAPAWSYHLTHELQIPGTEGWDLLAIDDKGNRLFVSHGTHVEVVDLSALKVVGSIADTPGVHGIAIAADLGRGYVTAGATSTVVVFDLQSLARLTEIKTTGENPDAILYEPKSHRVFAQNGLGRKS